MAVDQKVAGMVLACDAHRSISSMLGCSSEGSPDLRTGKQQGQEATQHCSGKQSGMDSAGGGENVQFSAIASVTNAQTFPISHL